MRAVRRLAAVAGLAALIALVAAPAVAAFPVSEECVVALKSTDLNGETVDTASSANPHGSTREDPFEMSSLGRVAWTWTSSHAVSAPTVGLSIFGVPIPSVGGSPGNTARSSDQGDISVSDVLPIELVGTVYVEAVLMDGGDKVCSGSAWIKLTGNPFSTPPFVAAAIVTLLGVAGIFWNARKKSPASGAVAGLFFGAGLALAAIVTGTLPFDAATPLTTIVGGTILGVITGVLGIPFLRGRPKGLPEAKPIPKMVPIHGPGSPETPTDVEITQSMGSPIWKDTGIHLEDEPNFPSPTISEPWARPPEATPNDGGGTATAVAPAPPKPPEPAPTAPPAPAPNPALDGLKRDLAGADPSTRAAAQPVMNQVDAALKGAGGAITIPSSLVATASKTGPVPVQLANGEVVLGSEDASVSVTPIVKDGKLELEKDPFTTIAGGIGLLGPLNDLLAKVNAAVAAAGMVVTSVSVTPGGITVTTGRKPV